jgi:hypothetical protein
MSNNINGGGRSRNALSSVDFYRRVPKDLTEVGLPRMELDFFVLSVDSYVRLPVLRTLFLAFWEFVSTSERLI